MDTRTRIYIIQALHQLGALFIFFSPLLLIILLSWWD